MVCSDVFSLAETKTNWALQDAHFKAFTRKNFLNDPNIINIRKFWLLKQTTKGETVYILK